MAKIIFVLGGSRSGKSRYAVNLADKLKKSVVFIATCTHPDKEMKARIKQHYKERPRHWELIEEGKNISSILTKIRNKCDLALIDCLGLWISNLLADRLKEQQIKNKINQFIAMFSKVKFTLILVSNEVGSGIVPDNPLVRRFQDLLGLTNQRIAEKADEVIFMVSGVPIKIKNRR